MNNGWAWYPWVFILSDKRPTLPESMSNELLKPLAVSLSNLEHCSELHVDEQRCQICLQDLLVTIRAKQVYILG